MIRYTSHDQLPFEEETALVVRAQAGDLEARDYLLETVTPFLWALACKVSVGNQTVLEDLFQIGVVSVLESIYKLRPGKVRLFTYIHSYLPRMLHHARRTLASAGNVSRGRMQDAVTLASCWHLLDTMRRTMGMEELTKVLGWGKIRYRGALLAVRRHLSLEGDDAWKMGETGWGTNPLRPEKAMQTWDVPKTQKLDLEHALEAALGKLSSKEQWVLVNRFGLRGNEPKTLATMGRELGRSRERIRQIEYRALKKLRRGEMQKKLADYWYGVDEE